MRQENEKGATFVSCKRIGSKVRRSSRIRDDISSVAFWYQLEPHTPFPKLPSKDELEID
jgi:hypothetical protein